MSTVTKRPRRTKTRWFRYIRQYLRGDLSAEKFCQLHNLGNVAFHRWRLQYLQEHPPEPLPSSFAEVPVPTVQTVPVPLAQNAVLHVGDSLRLELHQIDTAALTTLIRGLQHG
jgi:hypothetical protein